MTQADFEYISHFFHTTRRYIQRHNHSCYELVYYYEGIGETSINKDKVLRYSPDTYVIYKPYDFHTETHDTDSLVYCLGFHLDTNCPLSPESGLYTDTEHVIRSFIEKISQEVIQKAPFYNLAAQNYLNQLLITHQRNHGDCQGSRPSIQYIIKFLDENFSQNISLPFLAKMSGYSYDYFRHLFKELVGISPKSYILNKRINYAKQLLIREELSVTDIARLSGFSDTPQFNVLFKKHVGMPPLQYKKEYHRVQQNVTNHSEQ